MRVPLKHLCIGIVCCIFAQALHAQNTAKKPFSISGGINTSVNFYTSNENDSFKTRPGYAWNINGSFVPKINKFSFPFSFVLNDYKKSTSPTYFQAGISPTYKWIKLHFGTRYMRFSPLVFDGRSFTGAGVELNPKSFRFAAFYGRLNKAVDQDSINGNLPRYSRRAYGFKIGVGNSANYVDLMYFNAKDDSTSVIFQKDNANSDSIANTVSPQENAVVGGAFKLTFFKKLVFTGEAAVSGLTQNLAAEPLNLDSSYQYKKLSDFVSNFMTVNSSSFASVAGQSALSFYSRYFNANLNYRRVEPNFNSLGTPYIINDIELFSFTNNFSVAKGKINVNSGISHQHNNLDKNLNSEVQTLSGNIGVNAMVGKHLNLNANYFGYGLNQKDGITKLADSNRMNQNVSQFNFTPSYNFTKNNKFHFISGNINFSSLDNTNFATSATKNSTLSTFLGYTLGLVKQSCNFSVNGLYSHYEQDLSAYNSYGANIGSSVAMLKEKNLNLQANIGYFVNRYTDTISENNTNNITYSFNAGYSVKRHSFNFFINYLYTPPKIINDIINKTFQYAAAFKSFTGSISYNYRF